MPPIARIDSNTVRRLFIMGPPKCGTTSLALWLGAHDSICVSNPKEPHFFGSDLGDQIRRVSTADDYQKFCFADLSVAHKVCVDASVYMLRSRTATEEIIEAFPEARFLVILRHPVDIFESLHAQYRWRSMEDQESPWKAWQLQDERGHRRSLPPGNWRTELLDYRQTVSVGSQTQQLREVAGERLLAIDFDDLRLHPQQVWSAVLTHTGLAPDFPCDFKKHNARKSARTSQLQRTILGVQRSIPKPIRDRVISTKRALGLGGLSITGLATKLNRSNLLPPRLNAEEYRAIAHELAEEIAAVEQILGRKLANDR
ncbi:MAG: sulfotransferase [Phycisphaerales bacterium]|nr:sulfotransferase [Phycisphaerales bacterium]